MFTISPRASGNSIASTWVLVVSTKTTLRVVAATARIVMYTMKDLSALHPTAPVGSLIGLRRAWSVMSLPPVLVACVVEDMVRVNIKVRATARAMAPTTDFVYSFFIEVTSSLF
jgi:hypothetical protein